MLVEGRASTVVAGWWTLRRVNVGRLPRGGATWGPAGRGGNGCGTSWHSGNLRRQEMAEVTKRSGDAPEVAARRIATSAEGHGGGGPGLNPRCFTTRPEKSCREAFFPSSSQAVPPQQHLCPVRVRR